MQTTINISLDVPQSYQLPSTPILCEQQVPEHQSTLSYKVALPLYVRGIFFSRDSRPGDYQWPNNTNRLLPWMFNRLEDLTRSDYAGIPSNALPSASGDALLLELADGEYLFAKAIAGSNSLSWFQVNQDGTLTLYVSTLGEDALTGRLPLLIFRKSSSVYHVLRRGIICFANRDGLRFDIQRRGLRRKVAAG